MHGSHVRTQCMHAWANLLSMSWRLGVLPFCLPASGPNIQLAFMRFGEVTVGTGRHRSLSVGVCFVCPWLKCTLFKCHLASRCVSWCLASLVHPPTSALRNAKGRCWSGLATYGTHTRRTKGSRRLSTKLEGSSSRVQGALLNLERDCRLRLSRAV